MNDSAKDKFRTIPNPYIVGNPIRDQKMFFGREDDFNYIRKQVSGEQESALIVLCGSRRSGKTSILFQVMNGRLGDDYAPALIDMQAMTVENDLDFLIKLGQGIIDAVGDRDISIESDFLTRRSEGSLNAFQELVTKVISRLGGKKLILLFDEYEIFESHIAKGLISTQVFDLFSNWLDHGKGVFIVFTGSDKLEERDARVWERFLQKGKHQRISFLSRGDAFRLIKDPLAGVIEYEDGVPEAIWELTRGQPFYTQVFCQALVDHLNEVATTTVTMEHLDLVVEQVIENPLPQMIFAWNSLSNLEKLAASIIGELSRGAPQPARSEDIIAFARKEKIGFKIDANALKESLEKLFNHDVLSKDEEGRYTFKMGLWQRWVGRMHSIWQAIDEIKGSNELGEGLSPSKSKVGRLLTGVGAGVILLAGGAIGYGQFFGGGRSSGIVEGLDSTSVTIHAQPAEARIFMNDLRIGFGTVENARVAVGPVLLRVEADGFEAFTDSIVLEKGTPFELGVTLNEAMGGIRVDSRPVGATVYLDEEIVGKTPFTIEQLSVRQPHTVRLTLPNRTDRLYAGIIVREGEVTDLGTHSFEFATAQVSITSNPPDAAVTIDGRQQDKLTPAVFTLSHGTHTIVVSREGYADSRQEVRVPAPGGELSVKLTKLPPGKLVIILQPYGDVLIDGKLELQNRRRLDKELDVGTYEITLRNSNYADAGKTERVRVESNRTTTIQHNFQKGGE